MKKVFMILVLLALVAGIDGHWKPSCSNTNLAYAEEKPVIKIPNINASGDFGYLRNMGWVGGIGTDVVSYKDNLITLRAQALWATSSTVRDMNNVFLGAGLMFDIIQIVAKTKGEWKLIGVLQPRIGSSVGYDIGNRRFDYGVILQAVKVEF